MVHLQTTQPLNHVIQDSGFEHKYHRSPNAEQDSSVARIQAHLEFVCEEILSKKKSAKRDQVIQILNDYYKNGVFPSAFSFNQQDEIYCNDGLCDHSSRTPCFIDDNGVHCAAGFIMQQLGRENLAQDLNKNFRFNYIHEMIKHASDSDENKRIIDDLVAFLQDADLTAEEVATIQPTYNFKKPRKPVLPPSPPSPEDSCSSSDDDDVGLVVAPAPQLKQKETIVHENIKCDFCNVMPVEGIRYKCANCEDYDLCEKCEASGAHQHDETHVFVKIRKPLPANVTFDKPILEKNWYK